MSNGDARMTVTQTWHCQHQQINVTIVMADANASAFAHLNDDSGPSPVPGVLETAYVPLTVYPFLLVLCTLGNTVNLLVLSRLTKIRIKEVLLLGLAVSDTLIMWLALPRYLDHHAGVLGLHSYQQYPAVLLHGFGFFTWMQYTFYYVSDW